MLIGGMLGILALVLAASLPGILSPRGAHTARLVYAGVGSAAAVLVAIALLGLVPGGPPLPTTLVLSGLGLPGLGLHLRLDAVSAAFMLIVDLGVAIACLYAAGYARDDPAPGRVLPFFPIFVVGMNLVLLADDAFAFLLAWELMSLSSWMLVLRDRESAGSRKAAYLYLLMASFGTLALLLAFGVLAGPAGGYGFEAIRAVVPTPGWAALVLALTLLGAGSKAGLVPLHVWLPPAHAAAPSHVSAVMSGVMTKVAVYATVRILFDLAGPPAWWWGAVLMLVGVGSAVMGLLYALMQNDLKRFLAYSTVENLGIIFIALGFGLAFLANGLGALAAVALSAALLHALNHMLFKGLLFMGAGVVLHATGEREMDRLGGLIHVLPVTSACFLAGAAAISALPPLNGFVSEWLLFQAVLLSPALPEPFLRFLAPAVGALMALAAALATACFVRAYGIVFLGRPRSDAARAAHDMAGPARLGMVVAAAACVGIGILPGPVLDLFRVTVMALTGGAGMPTQVTQGWLSLVPLDTAHGTYNGLVLLAFVIISSVLTALFVRRFGSSATRRAPAWDCGFPDPSPRTQYTAGSFAQPLRRVFGEVAFLARERVDMPGPGETRPARFVLRWHDLVWERLYLPLAGATAAIADRLNGLQFLTVRVYLMMTFAALISLLLVVAIWR